VKETKGEIVGGYGIWVQGVQWSLGTLGRVKKKENKERREGVVVQCPFF